MIVLNVYNLCRLRGYMHPLKTLMQAGISQRVAWNYLNNENSSIQLAHIEILCTLLNCVPNDLFGWQPKEPAADTPGHPLQAIRRRPYTDVIAHLQQLTIAEAEALLKPKE